MKVELFPHQEKAVQDMHNGCVLAGDVGAGKTYTALAYALLKEAGRDIYVITTAKKRDSGDWEREAANLGVPVDKIMVDSWNNIKHYKGIYGAFFIFDEQRLVGTGAWVKSFYDIARKNHWILLSATPGDTWLDYVPVFVANGFYKNITEFRQEHVVYSRFSKYPKVERYINPGLLQRRRKLILVEMPMERHTTRHIHMVETDYDHELFEKVWKRRWNVYEDQPLKDAGELFRVGRKVVNSDPSRLAAVAELLQTHPKLIVFYNFDYELEMLRSLADSGGLSSTVSTSQSTRSMPSGAESVGVTSLETGPIKTLLHEKSDPLRGTIWEEGFDEKDPSTWTSSTGYSESSQKTSFCLGSDSGFNTSTVVGDSNTSRLEEGQPSFAVAEWNGHKHEPIPETDSWLYLVQYNSGSEGWNCIETDAVVFLSLTYSYKQFYQAQGRIDRMNTPYSDLHYYVLASKSMVDKAVWRALKQKKDFNLRGFKL